MTIRVRKHGDWMSKNDERILEFLSANPRRRPQEIQDGLDVNGIALRLEYVDDRLEKLVRAGLVEKAELRYSISDRGLAYLEGAFDASTVQLARF